MDDNGYDDGIGYDDGEYVEIASTVITVDREDAPYVAVHKQFSVLSDSNENERLLLDPLDGLRARYPNEIGPNYTVSLLRPNAHVKRKGPHRAIWQLTISAEEKRVDATVTRVPPAS
jgi:hypothetical protein